MNRTALLGSLLASAAACAPLPAPVATPVAMPRDLVVLVADPETATVGEATVATALGTVMLARAGEGTAVQAGQPPSPPVVYSPDDVQRLFGGTLRAMAPAAQRFSLYFETGSSVLTADSKALLQRVVDATRARVAVEVSVIGHTDTAGPAAANVEIGRRRARAVGGLLVAQGIDPQVITVASHGESNLIVPTPDNTDEVRNRRVEVTIR